MKKSTDRWFLHLSDFHIAEPDGEIQFLRKGYYQEFMHGFAIKVLEVITADRLAAVIFTGDLVDRASLDCLAHAENVLTLLLTELALDRKSVVMCHGNHDFDRKLANKAYSKAIAPINELLGRYGELVPDCQNPLGSLYKVPDGGFILALDSLLNPRKRRAGYPGYPANAQVDAVFDMVKDHVHSRDTLIVASHHPLSDFDEIDQVDDRIWSGGRSLAKRLSDLRSNASNASIWLSGDFHIPTESRSFGAFTCILGCHLDNRPSATTQLPGAVLIRLRDGSRSGESMIIRLAQASHQIQPSGGKWQRQERQSFPASMPKSEGLIGAKKKSKLVLRPRTGTRIELVEDNGEAVTGGGPSLEEKVCETIARERLYHLGRFEIAEDQISLGWVSIGPLLAGAPQRGPAFSVITPLLPLIVLHMKNWLSKKLADAKIAPKRESVVLLGIDSWGAVISSQLSVMLGFRNFCIAGRGAGIHHTPFERVTQRVRNEVRAASRVVLITDVIATGRTLRSLYDTVIQGRKRKSGGAKWIALSILADEQTERGTTLKFLDSIGCACKKLRIPLITASELPEVETLPATLKFARETFR